MQILFNPKICMLCFVWINSVLLNLLYVWIIVLLLLIAVMYHIMLYQNNHVHRCTDKQTMTVRFVQNLNFRFLQDFFQTKLKQFSCKIKPRFLFLKKKWLFDHFFLCFFFQLQVLCGLLERVTLTVLNFFSPLLVVWERLAHFLYFSQQTWERPFESLMFFSSDFQYS